MFSGFGLKSVSPVGLPELNQEIALRTENTERVGCYDATKGQTLLFV